MTKTIKNQIPQNEKIIYEHKCLHCGNKFESDNKKNVFCSNDCELKYPNQSKKLKRICPTCGKEFNTFRSLNSKFCSRKCKRIPLKRYQFICPTCGKEFTIDRKNRTFCSVSCNMKARTIQKKMQKEISTSENPTSNVKINSTSSKLDKSNKKNS